MKKIVIILPVFFLLFVSCNKWTETESMTEEFENTALSNLREVRDNFKWQAEANQKKESKEALELYWKQLREYKEKVWLNGGDAVGQKPMFYFWYAGGRWQATPGVASSWLQAVPDSVAAISLWGGLGGKMPGQLSENMKKDLDIFHKKGSVVLMCWQTSGPGLGLPGSLDGKVSGTEHFRNKYPYEPVEKENHQWAPIYARELARYIIALGIDGYDVDWETCGNHGNVTPQGPSFMVSDNNFKNIADFVKELSKYFGPHYSGVEREKYLTELFDPNTEGYHPNEKEFIEQFKPYLPEDYKTKRYYLCADIPCGVAPIFETETFATYFDKHFMQDYGAVGIGSHIKQLGGKYYNSVGLDIQTQRNKESFQKFYIKGEVINQKKIWGFGMYHGELDFDNTYETKEMKNYLQEKGLKRNYSYHAITREIIRIADPRPSYSNYKEDAPVIIIP